MQQAWAAPVNSTLDGRLFFYIVTAEMYAQTGDPAKAFQLMQEAARQQRNADLYRRAVNIALQSGSGGSALSAVRAWRKDFPTSDEAQRFELQILLALNRVSETAAPLKSLVQGLKGQAQVDAINSIPNTYANVKDKSDAVRTVRSALLGVKWDKPSAVAMHTSLGRMALAAGDLAGAVQEAQAAHRLDQTADWPALLALGLMEQGQSDAEAVVLSHAKATAAPAPHKHTVALAYARVLVNLERWAEARTQLEHLQQRWPDVHESWLILGTLQVQANETELGEATLGRYLELSASSGPSDARTQALLQLAGLADQRGDLAAATHWLDQIPPEHDVISAHIRRASILRQQGRMAEARAVVRQAPERRAGDARLKFLAEAQLLRDAKDHAAAYEVYAQAVARFAPDADLVYEQASMAEKLERWDDMERLLRGLMQSHPDYEHAYNALGYSWAERNVRLPEAKALIEKAVALAPQDGYILDSLGWVEFRLGNHAQALLHLQRAFELKADAEIAAHWGEVLWVTGEREQALVVWRKGLSLNAENTTLRSTLQRFNVQP
jgi:tetratricopeptide (TPR) repeat protein